MNRISLLLSCALFAGAAYSDVPTSCPEDAASCRLIIEYNIPVVVDPPPVEPEPPVEPPPVEPPVPPEPGVGNEHFLAECQKAGVLDCVEYASVNETVQHGQDGSGVPNVPSWPATNSKCRWNGGDEDCYPVFEYGDCEVFNANMTSFSQDTYALASLRSPCYDTNAEAMRMVYWGDLGSSLQVSDWRSTSEIPTFVDTVFSVQYEFLLSPEFFHNPSGSNTAKLWRVQRSKQEGCSDKRWMDGRIGWISPDLVEMTFLTYCPTQYVSNNSVWKLTPDDAGKWFRATTTVYIQEGKVEFHARDIASGELVYQYTMTQDSNGNPLNLLPGNYEGSGFMIHSSSHQRGPVDYVNMPALYVRRTVVSSNPIAP